MDTEPTKEKLRWNAFSVRLVGFICVVCSLFYNNFLPFIPEYSFHWANSPKSQPNDIGPVAMCPIIYPAPEVCGVSTGGEQS